MRYVKYIVLASVMALMASCGTVRHQATYAPSRTVLQIEMQDMKYLGEVEVSVSYRTYLGLFRVIDKVNGEEYSSANKSLTNLDGINTSYIAPLNRAYGKVLKEYPEATYFQVVSYSKTSDRLFLSSDHECKAKVRAYKFVERQTPVVNVNCNHK